MRFVILFLIVLAGGCSSNPCIEPTEAMQFEFSIGRPQTLAGNTAEWARAQAEACGFVLRQQDPAE